MNEPEHNDFIRPITAEDDYFRHHKRPADPFWNESGVFGFMIPERRINGYFYVWHRPNMRLTSAGIAIWDDTGSESYDCLYSEWFHFNPMTDDTDMFDFTLANGMTCANISPLKHYNLSYESSECVLELDWKPFSHPPNQHFPGGKGLENLGGVHYEQAGRVTGTVSIAGEIMTVNCTHIRDYSRGPRPGPMRKVPGGGFDFASFDDQNWFVLSTVRPDPLAPIEPASIDAPGYGQLVLGGDMGRIVDARRQVTQRDPDGMPRHVSLWIVDEYGRELNSEASTINHLRWHSLWYQQWCLAEWSSEIGKGWGESNDWFDPSVARQFHRARDRKL